MRIVQVVPTLAYGDAVGNDVMAIGVLLRNLGYEMQIYTQNIDPRLPEGAATLFSGKPSFLPEDIVIYHAAIGTELNYILPTVGGRKIMRYHNITPPAFFHEYSPLSEKLCAEGYKGVEYLADKVDYCIADSEYNKQSLKEMGYTCPIEVCPILIPFSDYEKKPSREVVERYSNDGYTNLVFVGRVAPNKKHENVIRAFYCYHKYFNPKSRLFLVGSYGESDRYYQRLWRYVQLLGLTESVIFPGHIKFNEILAYYKIADVFLCMSEHEGFCVPLVEAMYFGVPIIAYDTTAIPYTLGGSGVLLNTNEPIAVAEAIAGVINDEEYRNTIVAKQYERLKDFSHEDVAERLKSLLLSIVEDSQNER